MPVKTSKRMMSLILVTSVLLWVVVVMGSQVVVFGIGQASPPGQKANEPQAASTSVEPIKVEGEVMVSKLVHKVDPIYPKLGIKARVQCRETLAIIVNEEGLVSDVRVTQGHPAFDDPSITAVKQWKFSPTLLNGKAVPVTTTVSIIYKLNKDDSPKITISGP